ncbi:MAG: alkaline phosphatase family protein [Deltaproteobacteria bacterium]|nr:alkaline phosphatase family protein [Deltaproteobacteria bacterium]
MEIVRPNTANKVVVVGLDGVPHSLLVRLAEAGVTPNISRILSEGMLSPMETTFPEISSVAWTSFMTGQNPGRHGIFGFTELAGDTYRLHFPGFGQVKEPVLWDVLEQYGLRSVVLNLPSTYPAPPVNGVLVSGFVAPRLEHAVYPPEIIPVLQGMNYRVDVDANLGHTSPEKLMEDLMDTLELRRKAFHYLWENHRWDLFLMVITGTDRLHHFLWDAWEEPGHKFVDAFRHYYRRLDHLVGEIYSLTPSDALFMMVSDHGFTRLRSHVYLNYWLHRNGYLFYEKDDPESVECINSKTRAFAMDPSRIYIHLQGRFSRGLVVPGQEAARLREELAERLCRMEVHIPDCLDPTASSTVRPIRRVYRKEEIYRGQFLNLAPDLVLESEPGFDLKGSTRTRHLADRKVFTGMHTRTDAFIFIRSKKASFPSPVRIVDCLPTILTSLGIPAGDSFDGQSLI